MLLTADRAFRDGTLAIKSQQKQSLFWFKQRGGHQKSTSQPELSSGGGSSLSSGKLSKLLVSTGDVTWQVHELIISR